MVSGGRMQTPGPGTYNLLKQSPPKKRPSTSGIINVPIKSKINWGLVNELFQNAF